MGSQLVENKVAYKLLAYKSLFIYTYIYIYIYI